MPFFTKPLWCIEKFKDSEKLDMCGHKDGYNYNIVKAKNEKEKTNWYPSSNIYFIDPITQAKLDLAVFCILLIFVILRLFLKKRSKTSIIRSLILGGLLLYLIIWSILIITKTDELRPIQ
jgi:uncharacterized protein YqhQ